MSIIPVVFFQQIPVEIFRIPLAAALVAVQDDLRRAEAGAQTGVHLGPLDGGERHTQRGSVWSLAKYLVGAVKAFIQIGNGGRGVLASALLILVEEKAGRHGLTFFNSRNEELTT